MFSFLLFFFCSCGHYTSKQNNESDEMTKKIIMYTLISYFSLLVFSSILFIIMACMFPNRVIKSGLLCPCLYDCCPGYWEGSYDYYYVKHKKGCKCGESCCSTMISELICDFDDCCTDCYHCCYCGYHQFTPGCCKIDYKVDNEYLHNDDCQAILGYLSPNIIILNLVIKLVLLPLIFLYGALYACCSCPRSDSEKEFEEKMKKRSAFLKKYG